MMQLYVPTNGDKLRLTGDWKFTLYNDDWRDRNRTLHELLQVEKVKRRYRYSIDPESTYEDYPEKIDVVLPAGTVLQVDRVYIRKFNKSATTVDDDFDSITFLVLEHPTIKREKGRKTLARFWVKLRDANTIEFEHAEPPRWSQA